MNRSSIYLSGLSCDHCARTVEKALLALPGVEAVEVTPDYEWANVTFDPSRVTLEQMALAIEKAGYGAEI